MRIDGRPQDLGFYTGLVDGYFGLQTHNGLMSYQREYGMYADGICGPETLRSLYFLSSRVTGGSLHAIREEELVRRSGPKLSGKRIIIDPGRGGNDHGMIAQGPAGPISESDILWDLASRLEGRMTAIGMETFLSRPTNRSPSDHERAATANAVGADLMISLRCEIQVQTILNHAWSETSHDILYKHKLGDGYGAKAMKGIARRFERIMDKYLIPAGFEIQKAQQEYEEAMSARLAGLRQRLRGLERG